MAILNSPPETPKPQDNQGNDAKKLVRDYMFRQYWSLRWWLITAVCLMSIYTINFERWIPGIGLTGFISFLMLMLGITAGAMFLNTEFLKAIRAKQLGTNFNWTKVRYVAWGVVLGNVVMLYWMIVMVYITWFSPNPTSTLIL